MKYQNLSITELDQTYFKIFLSLENLINKSILKIMKIFTRKYLVKLQNF